MKEKHTIIEKWPYRLRLRSDQPGAQDEFDRFMREHVSGKERYVEWKTTHPRQSFFFSPFGEIVLYNSFKDMAPSKIFYFMRFSRR